MNQRLFFRQRQRPEKQHTVRLSKILKPHDDLMIGQLAVLEVDFLLPEGVSEILGYLFFNVADATTTFVHVKLIQTTS